MRQIIQIFTILYVRAYNNHYWGKRYIWAIAILS